MKLVRIIIPAFSKISIFSKHARKTTALGPIIVASVINKMQGVRAEVIDENNYYGPKSKDGLPDHLTLQRKNPADIVGFYCGLTCTMERVWKIAKFYKELGVSTIAGAWHAHYCPEETLNHSIDVVVHGDAEAVVHEDGEPVIQDLIKALINKDSLQEISGISYKNNGIVQRNKPKLLENNDLDNLTCPNFDLLRFAKIKTYPINRTRGCGMKCEYCSVNGKPRFASAKSLFNTVKWLVDSRGAEYFFVVDDRIEQDLKGTMEFFEMIRDTYGNKLFFKVQMRLDSAKNISLLKVMKEAGVGCICVGYESPIEENLTTMSKGYTSSIMMIKWTETLKNYFGWVHGMFIIGYPSKDKKSTMKPTEIFEKYKRFIKKAKMHSIQILYAVPIPGAPLRKRLKLLNVPWSYYDGTRICFQPNDMTAKEIRWIGIKLMKGFYRATTCFKIITFPVDVFLRGRKEAYLRLKRNIIIFASYFLLRKWLKKQRALI